ncbi:MAG: heterodisulfide reductase-related iron-sulfur binding cluster, partial [Gaiellaceae bacterium]
MKRVAYYKGCLASLSAKELDISTKALAPKVGLELVELESVTCCGAGDIHEAEPDYYLHLNARILAYAAATGSDTLMTVCNVCTLNLRQANFQMLNDSELRARVNENLVSVGVPPYERDVEVRHFLWEI